ncbi:MAG: FlgK family flagellar hook-associated protein, partial [Planctomycetota bacterium]
VNELSAEIAGLNERIRDTVVHNGQASDLIDQRMHALRELAALTPIHVVYDDLGRADVRAGGLLLVSKDDATPLALGDDAETLAVRIGSAEGRRFQALGGEIGALLDVANRVAPEHQARLDALAATIAREVNRLHSTGLGRQGGFEQLTSTVHLDEGRPLSEAGLPFDLNPGDLVLSLRDVSTGEVTQTRVTFDPATHTLADLAAALDAVDHLTARAGSGRLQLSADAGYTFDATNRAPTAPGDLGGSAVALTGNVSLDADDTYTFTASGDGTIGTTAALTVTVTDAAGLTVAELDVGPDYEPGTLLDLPGGVAVGFGPGAVTAGDSLTVDLVAEPDAQGLFAALGLNTLFRGTTAAGIRVEPAVVADPGLVAAGRSNAASDGSNARRLAAVQEASLASLGGETVDGAYADLIGQVGLDSQMAQRSATTAGLQRDAAENQRDAVSGVNQDEEAVDLLRHQQLYTFASRYIQTINGLLGDLMDIL